MRDRNIEMLARIEAALYASGRPLSLEELQKAAGTDSSNKAIKMARELAQTINSYLHALELIELQDGSFALQLKLQYNKTNGIPDQSDCDKVEWYNYQFAYSVGKAYGEFYSNNFLVNKFASFWKLVANTFKDKE